MPFTTNKGVRLYWEEQGQGSPVLLIMGHRYSSAMWYPVWDALAAHHRVIRFDNRGTGSTDTVRGFEVTDLADDAVAVLDAAGIAKAHIYGVSMGGVITLDLALRHPARATSLILGCTGILSADKPRLPAFMRALYYLPRPLLAWLFSRRGHGYGSAAPVDKIAEDRAVLDKDICTMRGVAAQAAAMSRHRVSVGAVRGLTLPTLVLHGDEDGTVPFAYGTELAGALPNSQFVKLEGAGHNYFVAQSDKANAAVLDFLAKQDAAGTKLP